MDLRVAAYAVIERRGQILLTHWRRGHLHGWTLPGGGLEAGEDPRDAVVREIFEETGLTGKAGKLLGVDSRVMMREEVADGIDPALHTIRIVYRATVVDGPLQNEINGSSDEARWVPLKEVASLKTLSLVQTGLRMAGISHRAGASGGGTKVNTKGAAGKPSSAKNAAQKSSSGGATAPETPQAGQAESNGQSTAKAKNGRSRRSRSRSRARARKRTEQ